MAHVTRHGMSSDLITSSTILWSHFSPQVFAGFFIASSRSFVNAMRDIDMAIPYVLPSVRHSPVLC